MVKVLSKLEINSSFSDLKKLLKSRSYEESLDIKTAMNFLEEHYNNKLNSEIERLNYQRSELLNDLIKKNDLECQKLIIYKEEIYKEFLDSVSEISNQIARILYNEKNCIQIILRRIGEIVASHGSLVAVTSDKDLKVKVSGLDYENISNKITVDFIDTGVSLDSVLEKIEIDNKLESGVALFITKTFSIRVSVSQVYDYLRNLIEKFVKLKMSNLF